MQKKITLLVAASVILALLIGCAKTADSVVWQPVIPDTPDGTVLAVARALQEGHAEILWSALPESFRQAIIQLTRLFAEKMDPEVYDRAFALLMRAIEVLDDRKEVILASETFKSSGADADEFRAGLAHSQILTKTLGPSEIATVNGLSTVNWEQFLAITVSEIIKQAAAMEAEKGNMLDYLPTKVETLEETDDRATLRISSKKHEPEEVKVVLVEGHWIPVELAEGFPRFVKETTKSLSELTPEKMAAQKTQIMMFLGMAESLIEQVAVMKTSDEFDLAFGEMFRPFLGGMGMAKEHEWRYDEEPEAVEQ